MPVYKLITPRVNNLVLWYIFLGSLIKMVFFVNKNVEKLPKEVN